MPCRRDQISPVVEIKYLNPAFGIQLDSTPKRPSIHGFKMTNSIDHIVKSIIQMEPNFISPESVKNIVCVGQEKKKFEQEKVHKRPTQNC